MDRITITFLGTSSGTPTRDRNVASFAITLDGRVLLFDCGEGTPHQLLRSDVRGGAIEAVFVGHLHGDHVYGLPGLLASLSLNGRSEPLAIHGPHGLRAFLDGVLAASFHHPKFPIELREESEYYAAGVRVVFTRLDHTVESLGYCVIEDPRPGALDLERAGELGIPSGPLFGRLQRGEDIEFGGRVIHSSEVVGPERRGRRIAYCSDTRPARAAVELARGADVLIHEATYGSELAAEAGPRGHSTASEAAVIAREAGVKRLILTHFSPRYEDVGPLVAEARAVFPATEAASDLACFEVERPL